MTGLSPWLYWLINFIYDFFNFCLTASLSLLIIFMIGMPIYRSSDSIVAMAILMAVYGISSIPVVYAISFMFTNPSTAYIVVTLASLTITFLTMLTTFYLQVTRCMATL
ncbi:hypothetical protein GCK32_010312 [Trichostrongylus colubriformis]|uniref:ABC-2 type transporter transmembrane domain-containing protein n=1 Tax=Trichostrongylus colubriformis TaxID=6319 RepID=A0AAN8FJP4_TRICO